MDALTSLLLGMLQGVTEFLPISSSGHLAIAKALFGLQKQHSLFFDMVCHLGTLGAIFVVFYKDILSLKAKTWQQLCIATLPLFPCVLLFKKIQTIYADPKYLGWFFFITAFLLFLSSKISLKKSERPFRDACFVGLCQTLALLPGVSRSGATICSAKLLGWDSDEAFRFSFLLAIPAILGASTLEVIDLTLKGGLMDFTPSFIGFATSFITGYFSLLWLKRLGIRGKLGYFAWYCLCVGIVSLWLF